MSRSKGGRVGLYSLPLMLGLGAVAPLEAQDPREAQVARAFNEFDTARRLQLLTAILDPAAGPPSGPWPVGVQLLAQTMLEEGNDSLAGVYLRWAVRYSPDFQVDTVQFLPEVAAASAAARAFVRQSGTPADSLVATSWLWPPQGGDESMGRLQVSAPSVSGPLRTSVEGAGELSPETAVTLAPGSYRVSASAPGYDSLAVTREVLPGVTTVLELRPQRSAVAVAEPPPAENIAVQAQPRKKFPLLLLLGGVAAAGAVVVLVGGGGGGGNDDTGSITVEFPDF